MTDVERFERKDILETALRLGEGNAMLLLVALRLSVILFEFIVGQRLHFTPHHVASLRSRRTR